MGLALSGLGGSSGLLRSPASPTSGGYIYPIDVYGAPLISLSLRRLSTTYSGPVLRLWKTGGTTQEVSFTGDTIADGDLTSFWDGSTPVYVDRWYFQDGSGNFFGQTDTTRLPQIVDASGNVLKENGRQLLRLPGNTGLGWASANPTISQTFYALMSGTINGTPVNQGWCCASDSSTRDYQNGIIFWASGFGDGVATGADHSGAVNRSLAIDTRHTIEYSGNGTSIKLRYDDAPEGTFGALSATKKLGSVWLAARVYFGSPGYSTANRDVQEFLFWNGVDHSGNGLDSDAHAYYTNA